MNCAIDFEPPPSKPPQLYQLPKKGDWITLADVRQIEVDQELKGHGGEPIYGPRCRILIGKYFIIIECESLDEAKNIREEIAAACHASGR